MEAVLAEMTTCRDPQRRRRLLSTAIELTLGLADAAAAHYRGRGVEHDDLVQVARLALVKAALGYRPELGHSFAAYAVPTVAGEVKRHFRDHSWDVRPTRRLQERHLRVARERERLTQLHGHEPSSRDLAEGLDLTMAQIDEVEQCSAGFHALSLDLPPTDSAPAIVDTLAASDDPAQTVVDRLSLRGAVARLDAQTRRILHLSFVEERSQAQIGNELGLTQMKVSRILSRTMKQLRRDLLVDLPAA